MQTNKRKERNDDLIAIAYALDIVDMKTKSLKHISLEDAQKKMNFYGATSSFFIQFGQPYVRHKKYISRLPSEEISYNPPEKMEEYYFESGNENLRRAKSIWNSCNIRWSTGSSTSLLSNIDNYRIPDEARQSISLYIGDFFVLDSKLGYIVNYFIDKRGTFTLGIFFSSSSDEAKGGLEDYIEFSSEKLLRLMKNGDSVDYLRLIIDFEKRNGKKNTNKLKIYTSMLDRYIQP
jgi:hypothetical protein